MCLESVDQILLLLGECSQKTVWSVNTTTCVECISLRKMKSIKIVNSFEGTGEAGKGLEGQKSLQ